MSATQLTHRSTLPQVAAPCTRQQAQRVAFAGKCGPFSTTAFKAALPRVSTSRLSASTPSLTAIRASANGNGATSPVPKPAAAETAKTIVDLTPFGTLSTINSDGSPLGTYVNFVQDVTGQPMLRLRADAVHTVNLTSDSRCSLFVQPVDYPARNLARVTLIGKIEVLEGEEAQQAAANHRAVHSSGVGVDAPHDSDLFAKLHVDKCFYVGGMGATSQADVISKEDYQQAQPDPLRKVATKVVSGLNKDRLEDVVRIASNALGLSFENVLDAEMLWVDRLGIYLYASTQQGEGRIVRVPFHREAGDERDCQSLLTMMAQVAWEKERTYIPVMQAPPEAALN